MEDALLKHLIYLTLAASKLNILIRQASRSAGTSSSGNSKGSPQQHTEGRLPSKGISNIPNVSKSTRAAKVATRIVITLTIWLPLAAKPATRSATRFPSEISEASCRMSEMISSTSAIDDPDLMA
ncbi:hypothetical protein PIB30_027773 [Stylosanthes scabra]|uniref:Uncharacterized protein n=1 Tax=Stylosanthes scabra TaxID=79078 RepID=A0ABU6Z9W2_9FABA|nr:hypothetical protein [Stylosanthes scabra]